MQTPDTKNELESSKIRSPELQNRAQERPNVTRGILGNNFGSQNGRQNGREISWQEWQVWQMGSVADGRVKHMGKIGKRRQNKQWDSPAACQEQNKTVCTSAVEVGSSKI